MPTYGGVRIGPSDVRRVTPTIGPSLPGTRRGGNFNQGWGLETISMGVTLDIPEARRRIRLLSQNLRSVANKVLLASGNVLVDAWKEEIDAEGYGPNSFTGGELGLRNEVVEALEEETRRSTGRYYNSIKAEVDQDLEVHVGSTIPRPSGRGLNEASYPELLEYGTSQFEGMFILQHAIDNAGEEMQEEQFRIYSLLHKRTLMEGRAP